LAKGRG
jgi:hypothetical protein